MVQSMTPKRKWAPNQKVDRVELHKLLWMRADTRGLLVVRRAVLCEELGVKEWAMTRIMAELERNGWIKCIGRGQAKIPTYRVFEPVDNQTMAV